VAGVAFRACTSVFDENKRFNPRFDDSKTSALAADTVIVTIGQGIDSAGLGVATARAGASWPRRTRWRPASPAYSPVAMRCWARPPWWMPWRKGTGPPRPSTLTCAAPRWRQTDFAQVETASNPKPDAPKQPRVKMPQAAPAARLKDFTEIDLGYSPEQAMAEASGAWPAVCAASACSA
jgi:hypothetical protein